MRTDPPAPTTPQKQKKGCASRGHDSQRQCAIHSDSRAGTQGANMNEWSSDPPLPVQRYSSRVCPEPNNTRIVAPENKNVRRLSTVGVRHPCQFYVNRSNNDRRTLITLLYSFSSATTCYVALCRCHGCIHAPLNRPAVHFRMYRDCHRA